MEYNNPSNHSTQSQNIHQTRTAREVNLKVLSLCHPNIIVYQAPNTTSNKKKRTLTPDDDCDIPIFTAILNFIYAYLKHSLFINVELVP